MTKLEITLPAQSYPIIIGNGILGPCGRMFQEHCPDGRAAVVSDETVWALHGGLIERALQERGVNFIAIVIPPGERGKSLEALDRVYSELVQFGLKRNDPVIAFGGGVVGDLAGFAASSYMRGVPFIQVPTTLLAQVDSSVGGKVAINIEEGKNLVGSFYQPRMVLADTELLQTLPPREWNAGMAEVVKYAAIDAGALLPLLENDTDKRDRLEEIVSLCCRYKAAYVERDERDTGDRMMLNFGHTFGHAIERYYAFEKYNHGEAVAMGMALAARAGRLLGVTPPDVEARLLALMRMNNLSYELDVPVDEIIPLMSGDKKNSGGMITLVLLHDMGSPLLHRLSQDDLMELFSEGRHG